MKRVLCLLFFVLSVQFYFTACKTQTNTIETDEAIAKRSFVKKETITVGATPVRYGDFEQELIINGKNDVLFLYEALDKLRFVVERTNAWLDAFKTI